MFLGHYQTNFDTEKGRCAVPNSFRRQLGKRSIITKGYENSLVIIRSEDWEKVIAGMSKGTLLSSLSRQTDRFLLGNAFEISFDTQGRFVVPLKLREYASLGKEVLFVGVGTRIEVWDKAKWDANDRYLNENIAQISEKLNEQSQS